MSENLVDTLLYVAYGLVGLGVLSIILFLLKNVLSSPKQALRSLVGVGILVVLFGIFYGMSDGSPVPGIDVSAEVLRFIEGMLRLTYVAFVVGIGLLVLSELYNLVR